MNGGPHKDQNPTIPPGKHSKLLLHPSFRQTIAALRDVRVELPRFPVQEDMTIRTYDLPPQFVRLRPIEDQEKYDMNPKEGERIAHGGILVSAYDESINKFTALEGNAYFTSHSIVIVGPDRYLPVNMLTFYFYTKSRDLERKSEFIKHSENPKIDSEKDYLRDKMGLLFEYVPEDSLLFIDGPLIGGDVYTTFIGSMSRFHDKEIIPVFFVKNSDSNLVTDNTKGLANKFNSDLHWAHMLLKPGQRTCFFRYVDLKNERNTKVFCYFKSFDSSPLRVEFHAETFARYEDRMKSIVDLVHYFMLVQGNRKNPQIRPIAVAEEYARTTLKLVNFDRVMRSSGVSPTVNQERFAW